MNPSALFRPAHLALALLFSLPGLSVRAQEEAPLAKAIRPAAPDLISIDFPGGPLSKLAAKLNETGDAKLSIVQSPGLDPTLPAFSVRNVRVQAVIVAVGRILEPQGYSLIPIEQNLAVLSRDARPTAFAALQLNRKLDPAAGWSTEE